MPHTQPHADNIAHADWPVLPLVLDQVPDTLRRILSQEGVPWVDRASGRVQGRFVLFDSRMQACPGLSAGQFALDIDRLREGIDEDPFKLLDDERSERRGWQIGPLAVSEEVARIDKARVRRHLLGRLRQQIEHRGGIWLRLAAFPHPYRNAFNFRIDYDDYEANDFDATLTAIAGYESATSHFVCAADFDAQPLALRRFAGLDVGGHGYWHHTYRDVDENRHNIERGITVLRAAGIETSGFASPHGRFNRGISTVLNELKLAYSSEFGLAYSDLPFTPRGSQVLQIPVHPVCLGLFLEARRTVPHMTAEQAASLAADYWCEQASTQYAAGEPSFFYCHPTARLGRFPFVLRRLFEQVATCAATWRTTMSQFAEWWRARERAAIRVFARERSFCVMLDRDAGRWPLAVEYCCGEHVATMPVDRPEIEFSAAALAFHKRTSSSLGRSFTVHHPHNLKSMVRNYLDWERVTPAEEIPKHSFRQRVKRTLRKLLSA